MIDINNLYKKYGSHTVLDINKLIIESNKLTSIIGPNGSGKSTLLNAISKNIECDIGEIKIDGKNIKDYHRIAFAQKLAMMRQSTTFNIDISVEDLVSFGRYPYYNNREKNSEDIEIVNDSMNCTNVYNLKDKKVTQLSGGEKQRVILAMILAQQSDYILLDEPMNNLDLKASYELISLLRKLVDKQKKSVILIIHDLNIAFNYSDILILMNKGVVERNTHPSCIFNECVITDMGSNIINSNNQRTNVLSRVYDVNIKLSEVDNMYMCKYF